MNVVEISELQNYVGKSLGTSEWLTIDQERINAFADTTLDHQFIHVDKEAAKATPFGTTIAHGFLTLSLLSHFTGSLSDNVIPKGVYMGMNYGFDKVRFLSPVKVDSKVRAVAKLISATEKREGQHLLSCEITVEIEGEEKPALICEWLTLYFTA